MTDLTAGHQLSGKTDDEHSRHHGHHSHHRHHHDTTISIIFNSGSEIVTSYDESGAKNPRVNIFSGIELSTTGGAGGHPKAIVLAISNPATTMSFTLANEEYADKQHIRVKFDPHTGHITFQYTGAGAGPSDAVWQKVIAGLQYKNKADEPLNTIHNITLVSASPDSGTYASVQSQGSETIDVTCFYVGTRISTPNGTVAVEMLRPGDIVLTADGRDARVNWLGRQTVSSVFADKLRVLPIRIRAGALDENVPSADLLVSPDHAIFVEGILIHAAALVNDTSVVRETNVPSVFTYYHIELDEHALVIAEGTPAESFVDNVDRLGFDNWDEFEVLYPNGKIVEELPYPRAKGRRQVPAALRVRLTARSFDLLAENHVSAA